MDPATLEYQVVERTGPQDRLLVLCHGYGLSPAELTDRLELLDPDAEFLVVAPTAPFRHRDQAIWHRPSVSTETTEQYLASLAALDRLLGHLEATTGRPAGDAVVGGFSQGGGLSLSLLMHADVAHRPAAAFGIHSFPAPVDGFRVDRAAAAGRPAFLSGAREDRFAPVEVSRSAAALFRAVGLDLTYHEDDGDHDMSDAAAAAVGDWLATLDGDRPTAVGLPEPVATGDLSLFAELWQFV